MQTHRQACWGREYQALTTVWVGTVRLREGNYLLRVTQQGMGKAGVEALAVYPPASPGVFPVSPRVTLRNSSMSLSSNLCLAPPHLFFKVHTYLG